MKVLTLLILSFIITRKRHFYRPDPAKLSQRNPIRNRIRNAKSSTNPIHLTSSLTVITLTYLLALALTTIDLKNQYRELITTRRSGEYIIVEGRIGFPNKSLPIGFGYEFESDSPYLKYFPGNAILEIPSTPMRSYMDTPGFFIHPHKSNQTIKATFGKNFKGIWEEYDVVLFDSKPKPNPYFDDEYLRMFDSETIYDSMVVTEIRHLSKRLIFGRLFRDWNGISLEVELMAHPTGSMVFLDLIERTFYCGSYFSEGMIVILLTYLIINAGIYFL